MARKSLILQLALATLIGMPVVALVIDHFSDSVNLQVSLIGFTSIWRQLGIGIITGLVIAVVAQMIIASRLLRSVNAHYANMLGRFKLTWSEIILVSLCAGVGEEMLF